MKNSFLLLAFFEYKKIFKRKSTYMALLMAVLFSTLLPLGTLVGYTYEDGEKSIGKYEKMTIERNYVRALEGPLDEKLISMVIEKNSIAISDKKNFHDVIDGKPYLTNEVYEKYVQPYVEVRGIISSFYAPIGKKWDYDAIDRLKPSDAKYFYQIRMQKVSEILDSGFFTQAEVEKNVKMNKALTTPFYFAYAEGYISFIRLLSTGGVFIALAIAICLAPMFSGEYTGRTDQLILSSRYGKNKLICAKLFAGLSFAIVVAVATSLISLFTLLCAYGFDGAKANIQLFIPFSPFSLTMFQTAFCLIGITVMAILFISMLTLLLSSLLKAPFGTIIITTLVLFVPLFINVPINNRILYSIVNLLPTNMMKVKEAFSGYFFNLFGSAIAPPVFLPIFCTILIAAMLPFCYRAFKHHQIG